MTTDEFKKELQAVNEWLIKEYQSIRTGQASAAVLDNIKVDSYGAMSPLMQVATVGVEDAKSLFVSPYDKNQNKTIETAISDANLGLSVSATDKGVRVTFPDLTAERRDMLMKLAKEKLEDARVSIRGERDKMWSHIQAQEKAGEMSEDEKFGGKENMEEMVKKANEGLEEVYKNKENEIVE